MLWVDRRRSRDFITGGDTRQRSSSVLSPPTGHAWRDRKTQPRIRPLAETTLLIMRETAQELRRLLGLHSTRNQELQRIALSDPAAAIAVFRRLEQARPGACQQVTDAAHAVSLIGMDPFRRLLDALPEIRPGRHERAGGNPARAYSEGRSCGLLRRRTVRPQGPWHQPGDPDRRIAAEPGGVGPSGLSTRRPLRAHNAGARWRVDGDRVCRRTGRAAGGRQSPARHRVAFHNWRSRRCATIRLANTRPQTVKIADSLARTTRPAGSARKPMQRPSSCRSFSTSARDRACAWLHQQATEAARS